MEDVRTRTATEACSLSGPFPSREPRFIALYIALAFDNCCEMKSTKTFYALIIVLSSGLVRPKML